MNLISVHKKQTGFRNACWNVRMPSPPSRVRSRISNTLPWLAVVKHSVTTAFLLASLSVIAAALEVLLSLLPLTHLVLWARCAALFLFSADLLLLVVLVAVGTARCLRSLHDC